MATITEDYVSDKTFKLLKEKGFDDSCCRFVIESDETYHRGAPTLQMAMKYLREIHNCPIEILWHWNADSQCSEWYFGHHMELKPLPQIQYYDTYEKATEAAIKYCLENLI